MTETPGSIRGRRFPISLPVPDEIVLQLISSARGQSKAATAEQFLIERLRDPVVLQGLAAELRHLASLQGKSAEDLMVEFLQNKIPDAALDNIRGQSVDELFGG